MEQQFFRPTAAAVWRGFQASGKRHLILTGAKGSGKTTLINALFPQPRSGIATWAEPQRTVWLRDDSTGRMAQVGAFDSSLPGGENKMRLCQAGFREVGIPALLQCPKGRPLVIDEIGYLELGCAAYCTELWKTMDRTAVAAVLRKQDTALYRAITQRQDVFLVDLDEPYGDVGCVIMASGLGTRFGGNKLMADFCGEPLICRALTATAGIFSRRVVVTRHRDVAEFCRERGIEVVLHGLPDRSDTVRLGLEAVGSAAGCLFCPGDQPQLTRETVAAITLAAGSDRNGIWRTEFQGTPGAPVLFPRWAFPELLKLPQGKGGGYVAKCHPELVRGIRVPDVRELMDVDRPEDLAALQKTTREPSGGRE